MSGNDNGMTVAGREILASTSRKQVWELQDSRAVMQTVENCFVVVLRLDKAVHLEISDKAECAEMS